MTGSAMRKRKSFAQRRRPDMQKEDIDYTEKRLAAVKELAKYDR